MQRIHELLDSIENEEDREYISAILPEFKKIECLVCGGLGHTATKCTTKRIITRQARGANVGFLWGAVKSDLKMDHMKLVQDVAAELRKPAQRTMSGHTVSTQAVVTAQPALIPFVGLDQVVKKEGMQIETTK